MSINRDRANQAVLAKLAGRHAPARELPQPLLVAALGAGSGGGAAGPWGERVAFAEEGTFLSVGRAYYWATDEWLALTPDIGFRALVGVCEASDLETGAASLVIAGSMARSGTTGAALYADAAGDLTETSPGDPGDETMEAPWVWPVGWQVTSTRAIILPCDPYRPRIIRYCLLDGITQLELPMREMPA